MAAFILSSAISICMAALLSFTAHSTRYLTTYIFAAFIAWYEQPSQKRHFAISMYHFQGHLLCIAVCISQLLIRHHIQFVAEMYGWLDGLAHDTGLEMIASLWMTTYLVVAIESAAAALIWVFWVAGSVLAARRTDSNDVSKGPAVEETDMENGGGWVVEKREYV